MNGWIASLALVLSACGAGDDTEAGTRGQCAQGGALDECPPADQTVEGACWRLVDCAAIPLHSNDNNRFDWDNCTNALDRLTSDRQRLVIECIAASTCDELKVDGSPDDPNTAQMHCLLFGGT
jgi:hypothetical protein